MVRIRVAMIAAACAVGAAASVASCGIDSYLTCGAPCVDGAVDVAPSDAGSGDAPSFDGFPDAPACDAAPSCFDAGVPAGWTPIAFAGPQSLGSLPSCPPGFASSDLVSNPAVPMGACSCSACTASGKWSCSDHIGIGGGSCDVIVFDASTSGCSSFTSPSRTQLELSSQRSGNPTCGTSTPNGTGSLTDTPARACTPSSCSESVCGQASLAACIYSAGMVSVCPPGFPTQTFAGSAATLDCSACPKCALANADAGCTPTLELYAAQNCGGAPVQSYATQNQCTSLQVSSAFLSVYDEAGVPAPSCDYGGGNVSSTAQLANPITICCP